MSPPFEIFVPGLAQPLSQQYASGASIRKPSLVPHIGPVAALVAGILILIMPRLLNYIVALYLIFVGLIGLFPNLLG